jgi:predicted phosphodiesterase
MRLGVISDIHANLPALEAVMAEIDDADVDEVWSLGDVVGYGADPDACATVVKERTTLSLVGNHDLAVLDELDLSTFSPAAADAVRWTKRAADAGTIAYLRDLEPLDISRDAAAYHASPRDPVWEYVLWPEQAAECMEVQAKRVSLVGHSHLALHFGPGPGREVRAEQPGEGSTVDLSEGRWLLNPGSVGQPRDRDPRAAWLELDISSWEARWHRVAYDIDRAVAAIAAADLPEQLGRRLYSGQ